ncbi:MAG: type II toxin-antitoxin system HicB family antitoxin [bacterium]
MLTEYIYKKLNQARYKMLEDGSYFGEIRDLPGVWASEKKLEDCRESLREVLEEWLILKLKDGDSIPELSDKINRRVKLSAFKHA